VLVHRARTAGGGRVRPESGEGGGVAGRVAPPGGRRGQHQARDGGVARRLSSTRSFNAEPWMSSLAENVWKDYPLETIDDNT